MSWPMRQRFGGVCAIVLELLRPFSEFNVYPVERNALSDVAHVRWSISRDLLNS